MQGIKLRHVVLIAAVFIILLVGTLRFFHGVNKAAAAVAVRATEVEKEHRLSGYSLDIKPSPEKDWTMSFPKALLERHGAGDVAVRGVLQLRGRYREGAGAAYFDLSIRGHGRSWRCSISDKSTMSDWRSARESLALWVEENFPRQ